MRLAGAGLGWIRAAAPPAGDGRLSASAVAGSRRAGTELAPSGFEAKETVKRLQ